MYKDYLVRRYKFLCKTYNDLQKSNNIAKQLQISEIKREINDCIFDLRKYEENCNNSNRFIHTVL